MEKEKEYWHVGKEIPIALVFAIAVQTIAGIWWAASFTATVTTKLDDLSYQVAALTADKYTQHDARRDMQIVDAKIDSIKQSINNLKEDAKWRQKR